MIGSLLNSTWTFLERLTNRSLAWIGSLLSKMFDALFDFLRLIFQPILIVIGIMFYLLYKVGELIVLLLQVLLGVGKLLYAFVSGILATLGGFTFTPTTRDDGEWTSIFTNVVSGLEHYQIDTLAYVLMFLVWFATAFAAVRILSSVRLGGD